MARTSLGLITLILLGAASGQTAQYTEALNLFQQLSANGVPPPKLSVEAAAAELARFPPIQKENDLLRFESWDHVQAQMDYLDSATHNRIYQQYLDNGKKDNTDDVAKTFNINLFFDQFEAQYQFSSLFRVLHERKVLWSSMVDNPPPAEDPEIGQVSDEELQVLLNVYSEIKVGNNYYRVSPLEAKEYLSYAVLVASRAALATSPSGPSARLLQTNSCVDNIYGVKTIVHASLKYRIRVYVHHYCFPCVGLMRNYKVKAKLRMDRKIGTAWWPSFRPVYASAHGLVSGLFFHPSPPTVYRDLCQTSYAYNTANVSYEFGIFRLKHIVYVNHKAKLTWSRGDFFGATGLSPALIIAWPFQV